MRNRMMAAAGVLALAITAACGGGAPPQQGTQSVDAPASGPDLQINGAGPHVAEESAAGAAIPGQHMGVQRGA